MGVHLDSAAIALAPVVGAADVLAGGERYLEMFPDFKGEKVKVGALAEETARRLAKMAKEGKRILVLASGDPLFFGIGAMFAGIVPKERLTLVPNVSAAQVFFAELGVPWHSAKFFSVHGRGKPLPWRDVLSSGLSAVYCGPSNTASDVARELVERFPECSGRRAAAAENLGAPSAKIFEGKLAEIAEMGFGGLSILALLPEESPAAVGDPGLPLGESDDFYEREGDVMTRAEVRAVALSKLRLGPGTMWDLGAGSGSVGIEAAALCPALSVRAVERKSERAAMLARNAEKMGVGNIQVAIGEALMEMERLPAPRSVFLGGGGSEAAEIAEKAFGRLLPGGVLVAAAITLDTKSLLSGVMKDHLSEVVSVSISRSRKLADTAYLKPLNPVDLYVFAKPAGDGGKD